MSGPPARRFLCTEAARVRGDSLVGTVAPTRRWLLIEHPGPWQRDAFDGLGLPEPVLAALVAAISGQGVRALVVRRPGRQVPAPDRAWGVLDQPGGGARWGRWAEPADLLAAAAALADPDDLPPAREQTLLVCAHGRHDTCCAIWGRPVATVLTTRWPEQTWECSHLGGDRFAANLLIAPDGLYYGRLDVGSAVGVVDAHLRGAVDPTFLRGSTAMAPVLQAALVAAHERFGPAPARAVRADGLELVAPDRWAVRLAADPPLPARIDAVVVRTRQPPTLLTCSATTASWAAVFTVESMAPAGLSC